MIDDKSYISGSEVFVSKYVRRSRFGLFSRLARLFGRSHEKSFSSREDYTVYRNHDLKACEVSVCISLYNYDHYIDTAVESVMRNKGLTVEIVIVNDCSTDDSLAKAMGYLRSSHPVTVIDKHVNTGLIDTRNLGLMHCVGDKVFILDADNSIHDDCLSEHFKMLQSNPGMAACYAVVECFDESGRLVRKVSDRPFEYQALKSGNYIDAMAMFDRRILIDIGCYDSKMTEVGIGWEDYELWMRIGSLGFSVGYIDKPLSRYLVKSDSMLSITDSVYVGELKKYLNKKYDAHIQ